MTMAHLAAQRLRCLASPRPRRPARSRAHATAELLLRLSCAALLGWIGYIHLHLWLEGYRHIPVNGPLFLLNALAAFVFAGVLLTWPRPLAALGAAGFTTTTIAALIISLTAGLFGFRESIHAAFVAESLAIEFITVIALLAWTALTAQPPAAQQVTRPSRARRRAQPGPR